MQNMAAPDQSPLLAAVLENTDGPMFSLDLRYRYTGFNRAHAAGMKRLYGAEIEIGHEMAEYMTNAADWQFIRAKITEAMEGKKFMASTCLGNAELTRRYVAFFFTPARDEQGTVSGVVVIAHIIAGHLAELDAAVQTLQLSLESAAASIVITNTQGNIEYVNAKFSEITGYSQQECLGKNPRLLKDPDKPSHEYQDLWATITGGRTWKGIFRNVKKDGSFYWEAASISPVFDPDGEIIRFVAVKEDITERYLAEMALKASEKKYQALARKIPLPLCFVNNEEQITFMNERFVEVFGYTEEDLTALSDWWRLAFPDDKYRRWAVKSWSEVVMAAVLHKQDMEPREYNVVCKTGEIRTVLISGVIIADGFLATFVDLTVRRRQEKLLKAAFERKKKNSLLNELITASLPSRQTLTASAKMLGMRVADAFDCFLVMMERYHGHAGENVTDYQEEYQRMMDSVVDELSDEACIAWESPDGVGVLCFGPPEAGSAAEMKQQQFRQAEMLIKTIVRTIPELEISVGIAARAESLTEIGLYYRQAAIAVRSGRKMWPLRKLHHYLDIGVFQVLPYINDKKQIADYIERTLGGLLRYEKKKKAEFLQTLEVILVSDNLQEAADSLNIHYKTLMFRKQRLEEILGVSLDSFSSRMTVAMAVNLMKLRGEK